MESIYKRLKLIPLWIIYILTTICIILAYMPIREIMIRQEGSFLAVISGVTLNIILLYFIWGMFSDKITKNKSKRFGWIVFFIGLFILTIIFRFVGGLETILG